MVRPLKWIILGVLGMSVVSVGLLLSERKTQQRASASLEKLGQIEDFTLTNQEGHEFGSKDLRGHAWIASFFFTSCAGPCPKLIGTLEQMHAEVHELGQVKLVSFSMDPEVDTPEVLKDYAAKYHADPERWAFLTGIKETIFQVVRQSFKLPAEINPDLHSTRFVLIDQLGHIRGYYDSLDQKDLDRLKQDVALLSTVDSHEEAEEASSSV